LGKFIKIYGIAVEKMNEAFITGWLESKDSDKTRHTIEVFSYGKGD